MKVALCLLLVLGVCFARTAWHQLEPMKYNFEMYEREFNKAYATPEERIHRRNLFENNLRDIIAHNREEHSWKRGVNRFTDRTTEEFKRLLGFDKGLGALYNELDVPTKVFSGSRALPKNVDWREKNIVSPVKDQGDCGSCWTFATAETVESYWALATGQLNVLSEQQVASCTSNPHSCGGTGGCEGGITQLAFEGIMHRGGLASEWTYPYLSYQGRDFNCLFDNTTTVPVVPLKGYHKLPSNDQNSLLNAVATSGPIAVSVDASQWSSYESGVFNGCNQVNPDIDHAVVLVGYGTDATTNQDYWLIRNSWSPSWGEDGYIRIYRSTKPTCGVDITPLEGTGCVGGRSNVTACGTCGILYASTIPVVDTSSL